jgi:hypothetical protein
VLFVLLSPILLRSTIVAPNLRRLSSRLLLP